MQLINKLTMLNQLKKEIADKDSNFCHLLLLTLCFSLSRKRKFQAFRQKCIPLIVYNTVLFIFVQVQHQIFLTWQMLSFRGKGRSKTQIWIYFLCGIEFFVDSFLWFIFNMDKIWEFDSEIFRFFFGNTT